MDSDAMDMLFLPATTYSPLEESSPKNNDISSQSECRTSPMELDPNVHSSAYFTPGTGCDPDHLEAFEPLFAGYEILAQGNPYYTKAEWQRDMTALTSMDTGSSSQSPVLDEYSIREILPNEPYSSSDFNSSLDIILSHEEKHESLMPSHLSLPLKRGPERQPRVVSPVHSSRPRSYKCSLARSPSVRSWRGPSTVRSSGVRSSFVKILDSISESHFPSRDSTETKGPIIAGKKNLFGPDGLLGPLPVAPDELMEPLPSPKEALFRGLSKKIKQQISEIHPSNPFTTTPTGTTKTNLPVSLSPIVQARLYSDLEMMICDSANNFLLHQYYDGRISQHSINKVLHQWGSKKRPQVHQFRFDQATQREFIMENRRTIALSGECSNNTVKFHSNMRNWKAIAVEMASRTFCLPDSAIRKNLYEILGILDMLNASISTLRDFNSLSGWAQSHMVDASELSRSQSLNHMSY